jgi:hypothetical protein
MAYNTSSIEAPANTESNSVTQKGYVEDINGTTFTAILLDEDGEAEFRAKIPIKDKISLHVGKILNFSVDKSSEMVTDFSEADDLITTELENQIYTFVVRDFDTVHAVHGNPSPHQNRFFGRRRNYGAVVVEEDFETSSSDKIAVARVEKVAGGRIFVNNNR